MSQNKTKSQTHKQQQREDRMELEGEVVEALGGTLFSVDCSSGDHSVIATLAGKLRQNQIRILPGDRVLLEVSPYDMSRGRITRRL